MRSCPSCKSGDSKLLYWVEAFHIVKCRQCGLVFLANPQADDLLYEHYHTSEEPDPNDYRSDSQNTALRELWFLNNQRIKELKHFKSKGNLLDIGCGRGFFLKSATEVGYQVSGIDIASRALDYARRTFNLSVNSTTLEELVSIGRRFDIITLWHVLEHFVDPYSSLRFVRDLMTENGICLIEVPNLYSLKFIISKDKWIGGNHPLYHRTFFSAASLHHALQITGFSRIVRLQLSYHIPGRNILYESIKKGLNIFGLDAFLDFVVWK